MVPHDASRSGLGWVSSTVGFAGLVSVALVAGCGGGGSPGVASVASATTNTKGSSSLAAAQGNKALDYSRCMRSNGVRSYPDPNSSCDLPKGKAQAFRVSTSEYQVAKHACRHLLPSGGSASLTSV
jgi:hypothetical protein